MAALAFVSTLLVGLAIAWSVWTIVAILTSPRNDSPTWSSLESERRQRLRMADVTYSRFEPLVNELSTLHSRFLNARKGTEFERALMFADEDTPWKPEEYFSCRQIDGLLAACVVGLIVSLFGGLLLACFISTGVFGSYSYNANQKVKQAAALRATSIKRRLPFAADLAAVMLEAGASFMDALKTVVRENGGHPMGHELGRVLRNIEMGRPRSEALYAFQQRLDDQDVTDLVVAINKGEELGTPLSIIMRNQADQMRLKRSQWGETAAAEAEVKMAFPSMIVTIACMLLILAPFALALLRNSF